METDNHQPDNPALPDNPTFYCQRLSCEGVTIITCIRRQSAKYQGGRFKYEDCQDCPQGQFNRDAFPDLIPVAKKKAKDAYGRCSWMRDKTIEGANPPSAAD